MSDSPQSLSPKGTNENQTKESPRYNTANIGQWASRQENPFAAQNRKAKVRKQESDLKRQKATPLVAFAVGAVLVAVAVWGLVMLVMTLLGSNALPEDLQIGSDGAAELQDRAQEIYNEYLQSNGSNDDSEPPSAEDTDAAINAAADYFNKQSNRAKDDAEKASVALVEMMFYGDNGQSQKVIDMRDKVNLDYLNDTQKIQYYGMLMNAASNTGDLELRQEVMEKMSEIVPEDGEIQQNG